MKFPDPKIGARPGLSFGLILLLLIVVSGVGYLEVRSISGTTIHLLREDAHMSEHGARARADVLLLRQYEKDVFLNVTDADAVDEYYGKWNDAKRHLERRVADIEAHAGSEEDKAKLKTIRDKLVAYAAGFHKVCGLIRDGTIATPRAANAAMAEYRAEGQGMEAIALEFAKEGSHRMDAHEPVVVAKTRRMAVFLALASLVAAIYIADRKRSAEALARSVRAYRILGRCNEAIVRAPDEGRLIGEICRILVEDGGYRLAWVGFAGRDETATVRPAAWAARNGADAGDPGPATEEGEDGREPAGAASRPERPIVLPELLNVPVHSRWTPETVKRRSASSMALPLACGAGKAIGVLKVHSDGKTMFDRDEIDLMTRLANDLAYGISAIRAFDGQTLLNEELMKSRETLRNLARDIQSAREEERARVAREIHDILGQELTVINMEVARLEKKLPAEQASLREKARSVRASIDAAIGTVQRISAELRPGVLDHLGITAAIAWQAKTFGERSGIPCAVAHPEREFDLDRDRATALFRIFQEALTNVARHSGAGRVEVDLGEDRGDLVMTVEDDGKGISMERVADVGSLGLVGMRERIRPFGGAVEIQGIDGRGTRLTVRIPCAGAERRA